MKRTLQTAVAILFAVLIAQTYVLKPAEASNAYLSAETFPNPYRASAVGEKFDVNVTIYQLSYYSGCYDAAFELAYNSTVIHVTSYALASLWGIYAVNDNAGTLQVDVSNPSSTPGGNVLIITVQFVVLIQGVSPLELASPLHLFNVRLFGTGGEISLSPPVDGLVIIMPRSPAPTAAFAWFPSTPKANQTVTFDAMDSTPGWNGTDYSPIIGYAWEFGDGNLTSGYYPTVFHTYTATGNYTITLGVTDADRFQANVTHVVGVQQVTIVGDINGDGTVDIYDAVKLAAAFGYGTGDRLFNPNADINGDGTVDIYDAVLLAKHYGQHYP